MPDLLDTPRKRPASTPQANDALEQAYHAWAASPSPGALGHILRQAEPVINSAMTSYAGGDNPVLRSRARVLAAESVKSYKPGTAASLKTWMTSNLQGLRRHSAELSPIRAPERVRLDAARIDQAATEYRDAMSREPTAEDLEELTGLPTKRIHYVRKLAKPVVSEGQLKGDQSESADEDAAEGFIPGVDTNSHLHAWAEYVYHDLSPTDKQIYDMSVGRNGNQAVPVGDIAKKLKVSSSAVSQRIKKITERLAEGLAYEGRV